MSSSSSIGSMKSEKVSFSESIIDVDGVNGVTFHLPAESPSQSPLTVTDNKNNTNGQNNNNINNVTTNNKKTHPNVNTNNSIELTQTNGKLDNTNNPSPSPTTTRAAVSSSLGFSPESEADPLVDIALEDNSSKRHGILDNWKEQVKELEGVSPEEGLTDMEVTERRLKFGRNEIIKNTVHPVIKFLLYFVGPMPFLLEAAVILSGVLGSYFDMGIILALLIINAVIGFHEEHSAAIALASLKSSIPITSNVLRSSKWLTLPTAEIVVGDRVHIKHGECIAADGILIHTTKIIDDRTNTHTYSSMLVDQSALTGESKKIKKSIGFELLSGSIVNEGDGQMIVTKVGTNTFSGKATQLVNNAPASGRFQKILFRIGSICILLCLANLIVIISFAVSRGYSGSDIATFVLVLTVASIPIALPTVMSVTLAVGANELKSKNAIAQRLTAVEELSSLNILCSDKTGTLTYNRLSVDKAVSIGDMPSDDVMFYAALACNWDVTDAIDKCILAALTEQQLKMRDEWEQVHLDPFDPVKKRMTATLKYKNSDIVHVDSFSKPSFGKRIKVSKGLPVKVLQQVMESYASAHLSSTDYLIVKEAFYRIVQDFASRGLRSLAVAIKNEDEENSVWQLVGMIPLFDPPRADSSDTIKELNHLGVEVKMITGDDSQIGIDTAARLGMKTEFVQAHDMRSLVNSTDPKHKQQLKEMITNMNGLGEAYPEDKYVVVKVLQEQGNVVGMTGDGANDAPALALANVGIAVAGATDAARHAADLILVSEGLSVICSSIKAAREIYQRMNVYSVYRLTCTTQILLVMTIMIVAFDTFLKPTQIIYMAIANDFVIIFVAYDNAIAAPKPVSWNMIRLFVKSLYLGIVQICLAVIMLTYTKNVLKYDNDVVLTLTYLFLSVEGSASMFSIRSTNMLAQYPSLKFGIALVTGEIAAVFISVYGLGMTAIGWHLAGVLLLYCFMCILVFDFFKHLFDRVIDPYVFPLDSPFVKTPLMEKETKSAELVQKSDAAQKV